MKTNIIFGEEDGEEGKEQEKQSEQQENNRIYNDSEETEEERNYQEQEEYAKQSEEDSQTEQFEEDRNSEDEEEYQNQDDENQITPHNDTKISENDISELEDMALDDLNDLPEIEEVDKPPSNDKEEPFENFEDEDDNEFGEISISYDDKNIPTFEVIPKKLDIKPPSSIKDCKIEFVLRHAFYFYFLGLAYIHKLDEKPEFVEKFMEKSKKQIDLLILRLEKTAVQIAPNTYKKIVENSEILGTLLIAASLHYNFHALAMEYKKNCKKEETKHKTQNQETAPIQKDMIPNRPDNVTNKNLSPY